jgi:VWFA-related protein
VRALAALLLLLTTPVRLPAATTAPEPPSGPCPAAAPELDAALSIAYTDRGSASTRVEGTLTLTAADGQATPPGAYRLDGEVVRGDRRIEGFRYLFAPAPSPAPVRLEFLRRLPAGHYRMQLALEEEATGRCHRESRELDVPGVAAAAAGASEEGAAVRLLAPVAELLTGKVRFDADVRGALVARVGFELDGHRVMTRSRPPWTVELDLGSSPRLHRVAAVALDSGGAELARDEATLNAGPQRFAVRLSLAEPAVPAPGAVEARAVVAVPEGETLDRVEFRVGGDLRATLYQPPFVQRLATPRGAPITWIRAVAFLDGGGAAEAVRTIGGAGTTNEQLDVELVELFATVLARHGRPVDDLRPGEVEIREDGRPQKLLRLEKIGDVPIHAAVMLDTSGSMEPELEEGERAALRFFQQVLTPLDRAAVITFADAPRLAVKFTGRLDRLAGGLADLRAQGETTLYDSLAFTLHYFTGLTGKRALILISDGVDSNSRTRFDDVLDYARRSGVAIYAVGLNVPTHPPNAGVVLDRLARETGGRSFRADGPLRLDAIYDDIEKDLRSQYLLTYQSDSTGGDDFRRVEVGIDRPGVSVRTATGYYP